MNARTVAARLGIALSTLNAWLAAEEEHPLAERRFHFHTFHGRKTLWSEAAFRALQRAIEAESEPGGILGGWRTGSDSRSRSAREAAAATMLAVLGFHHDEDHARDSEASAHDNDDDPEGEAGGGEDQGPPRGAP